MAFWLLAAYVVWLTPTLWTHHQLRGLASADLERRQASLTWLANLEPEDVRGLTLNRTLQTRIANLPTREMAAVYDVVADRFTQGYDWDLNWNLNELEGAIWKTYRQADMESFVLAAKLLGTRRSLNIYREPTSPLGGELFRRLHMSAEAVQRGDPDAPAHYRQLAGVARELNLWSRPEVSPAAWFLWLETLSQSSVPDHRRLAVRELADALRPHPQTAWHAPRTEYEVDATPIIHLLKSDPQNDIRRAAKWLEEAWSSADQRDAAREHAFRHVIPAETPASDSFFAADNLADASALEALFRVEARRTLEPGDAPSSESDLQHVPPLRLVLLANHPDGRASDWLKPGLTLALRHDEPALRALAAAIASRSLPTDKSLALAEEMLASLDPIERQSGYLLGLCLAAGDHADAESRADLAEFVEYVGQRPEGDPANRMLRRMYSALGDPLQGPRIEPLPSPDAWLDHPELPKPVVLTALLAHGSRAAYDRLLGPFGMAEDALVQWLDHLRFAWVLDAFMPPEAPRFPLWAEPATQREAVAALRHWYAQNRESFFQP